MLSALALALALVESPQAPAAVDPRADLQRFSARLEERLAAACRPAEPMVFISGLPETRFVYLDGIGAVFLLPPRSLPHSPVPKSGQNAPEISVGDPRTRLESVRIRVFRFPDGSGEPEMIDNPGGTVWTAPQTPPVTVTLSEKGFSRL